MARQILDPQPGAAQPFQHEQPLGEVGVDQDGLAAGLEKEAGVSDEGQRQLAVAR